MPDELPIVQVSPIADYLLGMLRNYKARFKNSLLDVNITFEDACQIIRAMVEQNITERLYWVAAPADATIAIASVIAGYGEPEHAKRTKSLDTHVFNEIEDLIESIVGQIMQCERTWYMWTTRRIGHDLWLEPGIDFRIHEWETAVREQRLDYPSHVSDAMHEEVNEQLLQEEVAARVPLTPYDLQHRLAFCKHITDRHSSGATYTRQRLEPMFVTIPDGSMRVP